MDRGIKIVRHFKEVFETYPMKFKDLKEGVEGGLKKQLPSQSFCKNKYINK